jgi:hypothetical protein
MLVAVEAGQVNKVDIQVTVLAALEAAALAGAGVVQQMAPESLLLQILVVAVVVLPEAQPIMLAALVVQA